MRPNPRTSIYGVATNDADYLVQQRVNGKHVMCPFYARWKHMLWRCYCSKHQARQPTYIGCTVCDEWLTFTNFKRWMENQHWKDKQLDKDLLVEGNKVYSPENCVFVDSTTNSFILINDTSRGEWPVGVYLNKAKKKFQASCRNPITKTREHLGYFTDPHEAHLAWRKRKHELACILAEQQSDPRAAHALRTRYSNNN